MLYLLMHKFRVGKFQNRERNLRAICSFLLDVFNVF